MGKIGDKRFSIFHFSFFSFHSRIQFRNASRKKKGDTRISIALPDESTNGK